MILTDKNILNEMKAGAIEITPFIRANLGSNSYDLTLGKHLLTYSFPQMVTWDGNGISEKSILDCRRENSYKRFEIPEDGYIMYPGILYLGSTVEYTRTRHHMPYIEGKSSVGRLGITAHITAGAGDIGFAGHWTLEITVVHPIRVYAGMPIAQVLFMLPLGDCIEPYSLKKSAKYHNQGAMPMPSMMWKNFPQKELI